MSQCVCVCQGTASCEHTMNTLRYANRVKQLKGDKAPGGAPNYNAYMPHQGAGMCVCVVFLESLLISTLTYLPHQGGGICVLPYIP